ncbi:MAG: hypothetical protein IT314_09155 [Anaerolineales bacterium]|nr:hypothetical protein [Anaerolineales bacterium]
MDWFPTLLAITTLVRGFGAGLIYDVALVSLPVRHKIGVIPYSKYAVATLMGNGVRTYGPVSILGALLTIAATVVSFSRREPAIVSWSIAIALLATVFAFLGTFRALPAVLSLRNAPEDEDSLSKTLNRFAYWHTFSTVWQLVSFIALVIALAN